MNFWKQLKTRLTQNLANDPKAVEEACFWRVDMHSHLLPNVDDGVSSPEETLACLQQMAAWGIQRVITTPHVSRDWYPNSSDMLRAGQLELQELADSHGLALQIDVAAEYMLDEFFPDLLDKNDLMTFGKERYVLIETGWAAAPQQLEDVLFRLQTKGYMPVLAHPERYTYYHADEAALARLHEIGCLFQLNWLSLTGRYGRKVRTQAQRILHNNWVDFIGSDLHRAEDLDALASLFTLPEYELLRSQPLRNESLR
ncbi:tyrosine-protein phosphatase [Spirosoma linguale]|uniref:protein-tyrosine-phosphatase n=1 Tax=Spirosoma linguale (strain ATCC 33905 / DSM 74 / LMG 10896 / Claus 1) TaxID=504472 RepID=D2QU96_SPILD|nr:PHP domain protein [Spirosoma linguale DSM 74]